MEWALSIADPATARQLADALTQALDEAHRVVREVADRFQGTTPPPPWPAPPELVRAIEVAKGHAEGLDVIDKASPEQKWHSGSKAYDTARAAGVDVLSKAAALAGQVDKLPTVKKAADLIPNLGKSLFEGSTLKWLAIGWVAWELYKGSKRGGRGRRGAWA